jgi:hypothetical protein
VKCRLVINSMSYRRRDRATGLGAGALILSSACGALE